jgi:nucleotide-binding universal stress UspA family protein
MHVLFGLGPDESVVETLDVVLDRIAETGDDLTVAVFGDPGDREALAAHAHERLAESDVPAEVREVTDDPGSRLVELAATEGFDRIVLPGGERSPLGKIQIHSVAEFVLLNATTTVTLIR